MNIQQKQRVSYALILLRQLVVTDFKLRYQGSVLGYVWSLLKPLFLFGTLYVVFVVIVGVDFGVAHSGVYLLTGILLWSFFSEITAGSVSAIVARGDLIRKLNFPKYVIVLATSLSAVVNMCLNLIILAVFMLVSGVELSLNVALFPLLVLQLYILGLGVGLFLSALYVRMRDVSHIWEVVMQAMFYFTPILFPLSFAPEWAQKVLIMNPVAQIIQDARYSLISPEVETITDVFSGTSNSGLIRLVPIAITLAVFVCGVWFFKKRAKTFAELV